MAFTEPDILIMTCHILYLLNMSWRSMNCFCVLHVLWTYLAFLVVARQPFSHYFCKHGVCCLSIMLNYRCSKTLLVRRYRRGKYMILQELYFIPFQKVFTTMTWHHSHPVLYSGYLWSYIEVYFCVTKGLWAHKSLLHFVSIFRKNLLFCLPASQRRR